MRFVRFVLFLIALGIAAPALAEMVAKPVDWTLDGTTFKSVLVYDDAVSAKRPGLLMVPNWYGVNDTAIAKAKQIAGKNYVILLADIYGEGVRPKSDADAKAAIMPFFGNRPKLRRRVVKAFAQLEAQAGAPMDPARLAAIGFCFGGTAVLDLARSGADAKAVIAFHAGLASDDPALAKSIKARVLVMNGADDAATAPDAPKFVKEMRGSPADWQFVELGKTVHCFTETEAAGKTGNCRYDATVAARTYAMMRTWLRDSFASN